MKEQIMQKLNAVIAALDNVSVSHNSNWRNMIGSIAVLEDILGLLDMCEIVVPEQQSAEE